MGRKAGVLKILVMFVVVWMVVLGGSRLLSDGEEAFGAQNSTPIESPPEVEKVGDSVVLVKATESEADAEAKRRRELQRIKEATLFVIMKTSISQPEKDGVSSILETWANDVSDYIFL